MVRHVLKISDLSKAELLSVVDKTIDLKKNPRKYSAALKDRTLLMLFQKPSLRTRVSFEVAMTQLGGHGIFYSIADSPLGVKESYEDTGKVLSRFVDIIMARVNKKEDVRQLAANSTVPVINALDDWAHPCQMLADLTTIVEKKGGVGCFKNLKMAYCGDVRNNVTYDLMRAAAVIGFEMRVAGPSGPGFDIHDEVLQECAELCKVSGGVVKVCRTAAEAVEGVDVVYTDSWMSYGIPKDQAEHRIKIFEPFRVTPELMKHAKPDAIFMNCLPAARGMEQSAEVIDGEQSVVFDEAENRLHSCKALMLFQLGSGGFPPPASSPVTKAGRILVALGGNALLQKGEKGTFEEAQRNCRITCLQLASLVAQGYELILTHGNGPQVGAIKLQNQIAAKDVPDMPLYVCGAESQGYLGFLFQQTLSNVLKEKGIDKPVVSVITQTRVDHDDPAFLKPTKPIGRFYSKEEAELLKTAGKTVIEDSGRGWRVTVPSPTPREILEGPSIRTLSSTGAIVISSGGGGIPVVRDTSGRLQGVEAVIDKDMSAALLARICDAEQMVILTDVDGAYLHYRDPAERKFLPRLTVPEALDLVDRGEFAAGSMGPKIKASVEFAKTTGHTAVIACLDKLLDAVAGKAGTIITR
eukprot:m51a1_g3115 putative carbamate kinase fused with ornithine carbamoyltransferase family protein (638) ;mRNA; f:168101-170228